MSLVCLPMESIKIETLTGWVERENDGSVWDFQEALEDGFVFIGSRFCLLVFILIVLVQFH